MIDHPFGSSEIAEVALPNAPLELVVAQVQFPPVVTISDGGSFIGPFQEALRREYPILSGEEEVQLLIGPTGPSPSGLQRVWRFQQHSGPWQVSLAPNFVSLSTAEYTNRSDFLARLATVLEALDRWLEPQVCDRFGIRYVSRIKDESLLTRLVDLVRPEVLGVASVDLTNDDISPAHAVTDSLFHRSDGSALHARWGLLPPHGTFDPSLAPAEGRSFALDFDVFMIEREEFSPVRIRERSTEFCEVQYRFFRWAVTDEYLRAFGGKV